MQFGIQNEIQFAKYLDHKTIADLPMQFQELVYSLFTDTKPTNKIDCWKSNRNEKADIKIKINGEVKGISIKIGHNCSVHQEQDISIFKFFTRIGIDYKIIEYTERFLKGYVGDKRVDANTYIKYHLREISAIKATFNDYYVKIQLIIRFLFMGTERQNYDCDAIIYGSINNFVWATKSEILEYLMAAKIPNLNRINIASLSIKCYDRNLRNNPQRVCKENQIQVKWYSIEEDLKKITAKREKNQ